MTGVLCIAVGGSAPGALSVSASNILAVNSIGLTVAGSSTASVFGGSGSYTCEWTPTGAGITFSGQTTATLGASRNVTTEGTSTGSATLLVTDSVSGATASTSISITLVNSA